MQTPRNSTTYHYFISMQPPCSDWKLNHKLCLLNRENYRIMAPVVTPRNSKKENIIYLNVKVSSLNLCRKAKSVQLLDKGPTTNFSLFTYFSIVPRYIGSPLSS